LTCIEDDAECENVKAQYAPTQTTLLTFMQDFVALKGRVHSVIKDFVT